MAEVGSDFRTACSSASVPERLLTYDGVGQRPVVAPLALVRVVGLSAARRMELRDLLRSTALGRRDESAIALPPVHRIQ
jgi:hypothetical protein